MLRMVPPPHAFAWGGNTSAQVARTRVCRHRAALRTAAGSTAAKAATSKRADKADASAPPPPSNPATPNRERPPEPARHEAGREELLEYYRQMLLIRRFEERAGQLYGLGLIGGVCQHYIEPAADAVGLQ